MRLCSGLWMLDSTELLCRIQVLQEHLLSFCFSNKQKSLAKVAQSFIYEMQCHCKWMSILVI